MLPCTRPLTEENIYNTGIKRGLYKTIIRPIVTFGAESWTITNKMERVFMTWERKILRKPYGPTYENGYWRIKMNQEIYNKFKSPNTLTAIKVCRLEWLGHVVRMDGARIVKKLLEGKPGGGRKKGRPTLRWIDDVESDLRNIGVKIKMALDRTEWAFIMTDAKTKRKGL
jgi:hypothetical protein